jgi:CRP-like cAMP-binding protein
MRSQSPALKTKTSALKEVLLASPIFGPLPNEELSWLVARFKLEEYEDQEPIFFQGDPSHSVYMVVLGKVKIVKSSETGQSVMLELILPGEVFGALAVFDGKPYPATAQAMGRACVARLNRNDVSDLISRRPEVASRTIMEVTDRVRKAHEMRMRMATQRVERRIVEALLELAPRIGQSVDEGIRIDLTRRDVAEIVGTTVETSIRVFSRLKSQGLVESHRGWIVLKSLEALRRVAPQWE